MHRPVDLQELLRSRVTGEGSRFIPGLQLAPGGMLWYFTPRSRSRNPGAHHRCRLKLIQDLPVQGGARSSGPGWRVEREANEEIPGGGYRVGPITDLLQSSLLRSQLNPAHIITPWLPQRAGEEIESVNVGGGRCGNCGRVSRDLQLLASRSPA